MANIKKDPRIIVYEDFSKTLSTKKHIWYVAMCYSFQISNENFLSRADEETTLAEMIDNLKNTFQVRIEGRKLSEFYKKGVDMFLLKYFSSIDQVKLKCKI